MTQTSRGSTATSGESTADQAKEQLRDTARVAQDKASSTLGQARSRLRDQVGQRSTQAGDQVTAIAHDMRSVAEQLRGQGKEWPARLADQLADRANSFGGYLRDADGERLLHDAETFARRQPWAVVAGGLTLGFAASRFLKASSSRRYQAGDDRPHGDGRAQGTTAPDYYTETPYAGTRGTAPVAGTADLTPGR